MAGRRCLVLGASGFLGRWLARALHAGGAHTTAQVRDRGHLPRDIAATAEVWVSDLGRPGSARDLIQRAQPQVVFSLVGYGVAKGERLARDYTRLNAELPAEIARELLRTAETRDATLVHVGSALEYGAEAGSLDEASNCLPTTEYGRSKLAGTLALEESRKEGLACLTGRAFTVFGLGEREGRLVPSLLAARDRSGRIPLSSGRQERDWIYVEDIARALVGLAAIAPKKIRAREAPFDAPAINLASGALRSVREFTELLARALDIREDRLGFGDLPGLAEEMFHPAVPIARLQRALGWTPPKDPTPAFRRMRTHLSAGVEA